MSAALDLRGRRFDRLIALDRLPQEEGRTKVRWLCRCDCGLTSVTTTDQLISGHTRSCGCLHKDNLRKRNRTHGLGRPGTYGTWSNMIQRCSNEKNPSYADYGGRGIKVCERWKMFEHFYADMGDRPPMTSIERSDFNGDYESGNCCWASNFDQARNKRSTRMLSHDGKTQCVTDWAKETGVSVGAIFARIDQCKWSVEKALTTPPLRPTEKPSKPKKERQSLMLEHGGRSQKVAAWAKELGIEEGVIRQRLALGWDVSKALTAPVKALKTGQTFTINGITKTTLQWAKEYGADPVRVRRRVLLGWSPEKALSDPIRPKARVSS